MRILAAVGALATVGALALTAFLFGRFYSVAGPLRTWTSAMDHWALIQSPHGFDDRHAPEQLPQRAAIELHTLFARCKVNEGNSPNSLL